MFKNSGCSSACLLLCCFVSAIGRATFEDTFDNAQWRKVQLWQAPAQAPCGSHWQGLQRIHLRDAGPLRLLLRQGRERRNCSIAPALLGLLSTRVAPLHKACPAPAPDLGSPVLLCTNLSLHQAFFALAASGFSVPQTLSTKVYTQKFKSRDAITHQRVLICRPTCHILYLT